MANPACKVLLTKAPLKAPENDVDPAAGAVVVFWGVVRELEDKRKIEGIDYEAHQAMAEHQLQLVAEAATDKFQLKKVTIHHRVGFVRAGEAVCDLRCDGNDIANGETAFVKKVAKGFAFHKLHH